MYSLLHTSVVQEFEKVDCQGYLLGVKSSYHYPSCRSFCMARSKPTLTLGCHISTFCPHTLLTPGSLWTECTNPMNKVKTKHNYLRESTFYFFSNKTKFFSNKTKILFIIIKSTASKLNKIHEIKELS